MSPFFVAGLEPLNPGVILELVELQLEASDSPGKNDIAGKELFFFSNHEIGEKIATWQKMGEKNFLMFGTRCSIISKNENPIHSWSRCFKKLG